MKQLFLLYTESTLWVYECTISEMYTPNLSGVCSASAGLIRVCNVSLLLSGKTCDKKLAVMLFENRWYILFVTLNVKWLAFTLPWVNDGCLACYRGSIQSLQTGVHAQCPPKVNPPSGKNTLPAFTPTQFTPPTHPPSPLPLLRLFLLYDLPPSRHTLCFNIWLPSLQEEKQKRKLCIFIISTEIHGC